jgi:NAD(P)-dependent dehydrogenase (short-subunit alcohol dehydrogenase family)
MRSFFKKYANRAPLGWMFNPQELKVALIYLVSPSVSYVKGNNLVVDGGWTAW